MMSFGPLKEQGVVRIQELAAGAERLNLVLVVCMDKHFKLDLFVAAFRANWRTLQYASSALRANPKIVKMAVHQDSRLSSSVGLCMELTPPRFGLWLYYSYYETTWWRRQFVSLKETALQLWQDWHALASASRDLQADNSLARLAVRRDGLALQMLAATRLFGGIPI